jgi:hypothetical protein
MQAVHLNSRLNRSHVRRQCQGKERKQRAGRGRGSIAEIDAIGGKLMLAGASEKAIENLRCGCVKVTEQAKELMQSASERNETTPRLSHFRTMRDLGASELP